MDDVGNGDRSGTRASLDPKRATIGGFTLLELVITMPLMALLLLGMG